MRGVPHRAPFSFLGRSTCREHPPRRRQHRALGDRSDWVDALAVASDSRRAVSVSRDLTLRVWDLTEDQGERTRQISTGAVEALALTPDGSCAISISAEKGLQKWDAGNGQPLQTLIKAGGQVSCIVVATDGCYSISSDGYPFLIWRPPKPRIVSFFFELNVLYLARKLSRLLIQPIASVIGIINLWLVEPYGYVRAVGCHVFYD